MKLKKMLQLWQTNDLITEMQSNNILAFMKERQRKNFFRLLKWLSIIGIFWLVCGVISFLFSLLEWDAFYNLLLKFSDMLRIIFSGVAEFLCKYIFIPIHDYLIHPICMFIKKIFGENRYYFYWGTVSLILAWISMFVDSKIKPNKDIDNLNLSDEQKTILKVNWALGTLSCIFLSCTFVMLNNMFLPEDNYSNFKIIPFGYIVGAIAFVSLAYKFQKNLYLVFGIIFTALSLGMFTGYNSACYWLSVSMPVLQIGMGIILLLVGYASQLKCKLMEKENEESNTYLIEKFMGTYNWAGLLFLFTALWIASFWGFDFNFKYAEASKVFEIWMANILFILTSVGAMFYGAKTEQKLFFNYGLIFLIIETYTVILGRLNDQIPTALATMITGALLIGTAHVLKKVYLKKNTAKEQ